ncbi:hypothetical protein GCM10023093_00450 [Nemorincola caseinilytica]|uniref:N-acetylmuramoyl-L-alanine amidase n=1 Tax=Nemorincola caseinilytica TaxID=2054315 RepID=A0ABP8N104_9BACT
MPFVACHKSDGNNIERARYHTLVMLDAAHGGADTGTTNADGKQEKAMVLALCKEMAAMAPLYNIEVLQTRNDDTDPPLGTRIGVTIAATPDVFLSLHINKAPAGTPARIYEIFLAPDEPFFAENSILTTAILSRLAVAGKDTVRTYKNALILRGHTQPALAVECGDIGKPDDVATMEDREQLCRYLLESIVTYSNAR